MSDVSTKAVNCKGCSLLTQPVSDPKSVLRRLPSRLFNQGRPGVLGPEAIFDEVFMDISVFGPLDGAGEPTPQWELARIIAQERDLFRLAWRQAEANQLGLGIQTVNESGEVEGQCPRAAGVDLDRVGEQFGLGRPHGFTDCCYWRFIVLMLFKPGPTLWLLREIAELYTGERPMVVEEPDKLTLIWSGDEGDSFFDQDDGGFLNQSAHYDGDDPPVQPASAFEGFWCSGGQVDLEAFWGGGNAGQAVGMDLKHAIAAVKPAGVFVVHQNQPPAGASGCGGATFRGEVDNDEFWA